MINGILPTVNSIILNRVVNSVISARLHTGRFKINPAKSRNKDGGKSAVAILKDARQLGCVCQDTEPPESLPSFYGRAQKTWDRFDECNAQNLRSVMRTSEKTKVRRSETFKSKFLISEMR